MRTNYFINKKFQTKIIGFSLFGGGVVGSIGLLVQWFMVNQMNALGTKVGLSPNHPFFTFIEEQWKYSSFTYGIGFLIQTLLVAGFGLFLSHRIAGPMFRLKADLDEMAKNRTLHPVTFRENDEFQEVAGSFNKVVSSVTATSIQNKKVA